LSEQLIIPETIIENTTTVGRIFFMLAILMNVEVSNIPPFGSSANRSFYEILIVLLKLSSSEINVSVRSIPFIF
jgi:hypothetical protein